MIEWLKASWGWIAGIVAAAVGFVALRLRLRSERQHGRAEGLAEGKHIQARETLAQTDLHRRLEAAKADAHAKAEAQAALQRAKRDLIAIETPDELLRQLDDFEER